jgi:hypothetical protein
VTEVLASPVDVDHVGPWERLARAPGFTFVGAVVVAVLATWGAASWPGFWLPLRLPLEIAWLSLGVLWLARLGVAISIGGWRDPRWLGAPGVVLVGALVVASGLPLAVRVGLTSKSLTHAVQAQQTLSDAGSLRHQCAHGLCLDAHLPRGAAGIARLPDDLGIYLNARNSVTAQALVWHPGGKPRYLPCGISGFDHVYGPWYVAKTAHVACFD